MLLIGKRWELALIALVFVIIIFKVVAFSQVEASVVLKGRWSHFISSKSSSESGWKL